MSDSSYPISVEPIRDIFDEATGNQQLLRDGKTGQYLATIEPVASVTSSEAIPLLRVENFRLDDLCAPQQFRLDYHIIDGYPQQSGLILLKDASARMPFCASSALLRTIGGFDNFAEQVWISVAGENGSFSFEAVSKLTENERIGKGIGYTTRSMSANQFNSIFFEKRPVRDNIMDRVNDVAWPDHITPRSAREQRVLEVLRLFPTLLFLRRNTWVSDLPVNCLDRYLLNLACVLVSEPRFLLLDHVLTGADDTTIDVFMATLLELLTKRSMITLIAEQGKVAERLEELAHQNVIFPDVEVQA